VRRAGAGLLLLAAGLLLAWVWQAGPPTAAAVDAVGQRPPPALADVAAVADAGHGAGTAASRQALPGTPAIPPSLVGSDPDGEARLDADGRLWPDHRLRRLFDWHRSAVGELDEMAIRARLRADLASRLPPAAVDEALALYERYLDYLAASDRLPFEPEPLRRLDQLRALRQMLFGDALAAALFEAEELALEARLLRRKIATDRQLDEVTRSERLAALDAALPAELRPPPEQLAVIEAEQLTAVYEADGVGAAERQRERAALYGAAAAERLAALDDARVDWQQRLDYFSAQRARLLQADLSPAEREARLRRWMAEHFAPSEQRRLQALLDEGLLDAGLHEAAAWPDG
jgi:lipase chaperone LimK